MEQKREESRWKKGGRILLAAAMIFLAGRGAAALFTAVDNDSEYRVCRG